MKYEEVNDKTVKVYPGFKKIKSLKKHCAWAGLQFEAVQSVKPVKGVERLATDYYLIDRAAFFRSVEVMKYQETQKPKPKRKRTKIDLAVLRQIIESEPSPGLQWKKAKEVMGICESAFYRNKRRIEYAITQPQAQPFRFGGSMCITF